MKKDIGIIKVQVPIIGNDCFVYNEDRSFQTMIPYTKEIRLLMGFQLKRYFFGTVNTSDNSLMIGKPAPEQRW